MKTKRLFGLASIFGLGLAACSGAGGDNTDAAYNPPQTDVAPPTVDTGAPPDPYVYVVVQDTEQVACNTNGPGVDVDAVALQDGAGTVLGYGKAGTAIYTPNPLGPACTICNTDKPCKYAANGGLFTVVDLQSRTEGPADGVVNATTDDKGYFSLNAGTLQIKIGAVGTGLDLTPKSGQFIYVFEVDQSYVTPSNGCVCLPEHFTVRLQTASGAYTAPLTPYPPATANAALCAANPGTASDGCGSSVFMIP